MMHNLTNNFVSFFGFIFILELLRPDSKSEFVYRSCNIIPNAVPKLASTTGTADQFERERERGGGGDRQTDIDIYIYIEREREGQRDGYIYIYIYIYI